MILVAIVLGTLLAGIGSVWLAAALSFGVLARYTQHMLSLAAGALLATAFMHLLPEAFESQVGAHELFMTLLVGLVFFFLLDKAELWHHGHEHHHEAVSDHEHVHHHHHEHQEHHHHAHEQQHSAHSHVPKAGSWAVLTGDSVHCFGDGVLIASAFMADMRLGVMGRCTTRSSCPHTAPVSAQAGHFHGDDVGHGAHAAAAVVHHRGRVAPGQQGFKLFLQLAIGLKRRPRPCCLQTGGSARPGCARPPGPAARLRHENAVRHGHRSMVCAGRPRF
jgi:hypothetical protein